MRNRIILFFYRFFKRNEIEVARKIGVSIGENCKLIGCPFWGSEPWLISIGNHVEISGNVSFITHDGSTWVFRNQERYKNVIRYGRIEIKDNCFIGARSIILPNVSIGPNSIVGAGSLVRKDVEPNSVYAGVPARRICSVEEFAEKCLKETPPYSLKDYKLDKKKEVIKVYNSQKDQQ